METVIDHPLPRSRTRRLLRDRWIKNVAESQGHDAVDKDQSQDKEPISRRRTKDRISLPSVREAEIKFLSVQEVGTLSQKLRVQILSDSKKNPENDHDDERSSPLLIAILRNVKRCACCFLGMKTHHERSLKSSSVMPWDDQRSSAVAINFSDS